MKRPFVLFVYAALCVLGSVQLCATTGGLLLPKGKTHSGSKVALDEKKIPGPTGAQGATGATGPIFLPVYATAYQSETKVVDGGETEIIVPFDTLQEAKGISLSNDTFTLPKGTYSVHFQFILNNLFDVGSFVFNEMKLDLGDGSTVPLDWSAAYNWDESLTGGFAEDTTVVGSKIFSIPNDNTEVKLVITRTATPTFSFIAVTKRPTRIVLHKIKG
jgi:hypothetical protein